MNKILKYLIFCTSFILIFSCNKDVVKPLPEENSPIFKVSGKIGNQNIELMAGESGSFMSTENIIKNGVEVFAGSLEGTQTSFSISISEGMIDIPSFNSNIEDFDSFKISPYNFNKPLAQYSIEDFPNEEYISSVSWTVDGENQMSNTLKIYEPGKYKICALVNYYNGSEGSACNEVIIGYQKNVYSVLRHEVSQNVSFTAVLDSPSESITSIEWLVNDSVISTSNSSDFKTTINGLNIYNFGANVTFDNGVYREKQLFVNVEEPNNYISDFSILENQSTLQWDHTATIIIEHKNKKYRAIQNSSNSAHITINDVNSFNQNNSGDKVSILKGELNCSFIDLSTQEILEGEFEFSFGIAH